ncbi:CheR family methyltransferase [Puerhibacterium sp. TATVAM-FAB25]|uniref:CheR family methyltransferase n=1 Tax=Puerhibacterium sp. TATVAM-FAB25 TaxID=3093699 RepID=UPI00397B9D3D
MSLAPDTFAFVADLVRRRSAIRLEAGKEYLVESRLLPLARERGCAGVDAFVREVRTAGREADLVRVVEALATHETSWFRDQTPFEALRTQVLPDVLRRRGPAARVRVWSAACSSGQEPYSVAMVAAETLPPGASIEILATDLSARILDQAGSGTYSQLEVNRGLPAPMIVRHMVRAGAQWQVAPALRRVVTFRQHNLLEPAPPGPFDLVLLRNVLIYFDLPTKQAILRRVRQVMAPGGVLVLGAAETTIGVDDAWQRVPAGRGSVYTLAAPAAPAPAVAPAPVGASSSPVSRFARLAVPSTPARLAGAPVPSRGAPL